MQGNGIKTVSIDWWGDRKMLSFSRKLIIEILSAICVFYMPEGKF